MGAFMGPVEQYKRKALSKQHLGSDNPLGRELGARKCTPPRVPGLRATQKLSRCSRTDDCDPFREPPGLEVRLNPWAGRSKLDLGRKGDGVKRTWTIIGVTDVPGSFKWYQALFGQPATLPAHDYFGQILDSDGTVLL